MCQRTWFTLLENGSKSNMWMQEEFISTESSNVSEAWAMSSHESWKACGCSSAIECSWIWVSILPQKHIWKEQIYVFDNIFSYFLMLLRQNTLCSKLKEQLFVLVYRDFSAQSADSKEGRHYRGEIVHGR